MRAIKELNAFQRDMKRVRANPRHRDVYELLSIALVHLCGDVPLPERYKDHPLSGEWRGSRDCHLTFDLVLIYRKPGPNLLELVRIGSHGELFRK
ncbi:MAG: type II toxin-antitoxin system YafQ family toxin [Bauldia sp.]|jgi:mRNA interferase YafQ|nr:type II toxin-antitoxin system YafQ family toxin [Bauldia sp.]